MLLIVYHFYNFLIKLLLLIVIDVYRFITLIYNIDLFLLQKHEAFCNYPFPKGCNDKKSEASNILW
jgi:hypothetical protein